MWWRRDERERRVTSNRVTCTRLECNHFSETTAFYEKLHIYSSGQKKVNVSFLFQRSFNDAYRSKKTNATRNIIAYGAVYTVRA